MDHKVRIGRSIYAVTPASALVPRPATPSSARSRLEFLTRQDGARLLDYLEREHLVEFGWQGDVVELAAHLLVRGDLVLVHHVAPVRVLDDIPIRDLILPVVDPDVRPPRDRPPPTEPDTWISFEVVRSDGVAVEGDFRCVVDARTEVGLLADGTHRYDPVAAGSAAQLYIDLLRWPAVADDIDPATIDPTTIDPAVDPNDPNGPNAPTPLVLGPDVVSFEVVAEDGTPWPGTGDLMFGANTVPIVLAGLHQAKVGANTTASVRLALDARAG